MAKLSIRRALNIFERKRENNYWYTCSCSPHSYFTNTSYGVSVSKIRFVEFEGNFAALWNVVSIIYTHLSNLCADQIETSTSLPRANFGHLTTICGRRVGNLTVRPSRGGDLTLALVGWGKLNRKCKVSNDFLFPAPKSLKAVNICLYEMEEFKGKAIAIR